MPSTRACRWFTSASRFAAASARPRVATLREANPRFLDTLPWEARRALVGSQTEAIDLYKGAELLGQAHQACPASHWLAV